MRGGLRFVCAVTRKGQFSSAAFHARRSLPPHPSKILDCEVAINGLPVTTFELKNGLTKQTVADAVEQYKRDRDPREKLFESSQGADRVA